jgi:hypothetical protein
MDLAKATELGYDVRREGAGSFRVQGHGLNTLYSEDDEQAWDDLIEGHGERKGLHEMSNEQRNRFLENPE